MRRLLSLRVRFMCLVFAAVFLGMGSSVGQVRFSESAGESPEVAMDRHKAIAPLDRNRSTEIYEAAYTELPRDLAELYVAADRITRANDLDVPFWVIRLCDATEECEAGPYVLPMNAYLLDMMQRDRDRVAFVMACNMAVDILQVQAKIDAFVGEELESYKKQLEKGRRSLEEVIAEILASEEFNDFVVAQEIEADALAYEYLVKAGYNWQGGVKALEAMEDLHSKTCQCDRFRNRLSAYLSLPMQSPLSPSEIQSGRTLLETTAPLPYELKDGGDFLRIFPAESNVWN